MEIDKKLIGNKIRILREMKGWTQKKLGLKTGITPNNITTIEKGKKFVSMDKVDKILEVFHISFDDLFEDILVDCQNSETDDLFYTSFKNSLNMMTLEDLKMTKELIQRICNSPQTNPHQKEPPQ